MSNNSHSTIILAGDFNVPGISWENGIGILNSTPQYGFELNSILFDILNDSACLTN